ncbi:uncharacterized protein PHALS_12373 [Plasmopara halstedii]|uniref:Uncharacterized protein n=1 Tax=Plasmopara halstedii TaxID=4781 RepID=A0A0N7L5P7_PLAHL|nr:uncharacterized protein PHALS_12373 [Plasmopara halstedii]CEG42067.1 hypothetical protein PHALS_12373 [Plasmopara halstedii]|eukprot:XP_024578436.1 hypothetical protein PHALS_12373 [Plasmopara halstedii]
MLLTNTISKSRTEALKPLVSSKNKRTALKHRKRCYGDVTDSAGGVIVSSEAARSTVMQGIKVTIMCEH